MRRQLAPCFPEIPLNGFRGIAATESTLARLLLGGYMLPNLPRMRKGAGTMAKRWSRWPISPARGFLSKGIRSLPYALFLTTERKGENNVHREHRDLCSSCAHVRTCGRRSTPAKPIFSCERYVEYALACSECGPQTAQQSSIDPGRLEGLCSNCRLRDTCCFPRPEGGVWHCEEYC